MDKTHVYQDQGQLFHSINLLILLRLRVVRMKIVCEDLTELNVTLQRSPDHFLFDP